MSRPGAKLAWLDLTVTTPAFTFQPLPRMALSARLKSSGNGSVTMDVTRRLNVRGDVPELASVTVMVIVAVPV